MNCYYCDLPMASDNAKFDTWGDRKVLAYKTCDRGALIARADELGILTKSWPGQHPGNHSDQVIIDAIAAADRLSAEWLDRLDKLPTDEAKRDAVHRLRLAMEAM